MKYYFLFFLSYCLTTQSIFAQTDNYINNDDTISDSLTYFLDQITITATRYPEQVMEIPYAVSVLNKSQMNNIRGYGLDEALSNIPGVLVQSRSGNQDIRLTIRGFGARGAGDRSNAGTSRGLKILLDGITETEPDGRTSFDQIDPNLAENIEIIRSNASAIWGNASGGVINISTVPAFNNSFLTAKSTLGAFGLRNYLLSAGTTLSNGKIYASYSSNNFGGWRKHSESYRSILNIGMLSDLAPKSILGIYITGASNTFHIPGPLTKAQFDADPVQANSTYEARDERRNNRTGRIGVTLEHTFDNFSSDVHKISSMVYLNPKYLQRSERGTFRDFTRYHTGGNFMYSFSSEPVYYARNNFSVGIDESYQDGAILFYNLSPINGRGDILRDNKSEGTNSFGAFIQNEVRLMDKLSIIIGGRYDNITYSYESFISSPHNYQKKSFEKLTPKAGLSYAFSPQHSIYANLGGGVEVPAGNETDPAGTYGQDTVYLINPLLEPITSTTYEIGTKHLLNFTDNTNLLFSYEAALYYIDIKNDIIPYRGGRFYFTAGRTYRTGFELGTSLEWNKLKLYSSLSYSVNKYDSYKVDSVHYDLKKAGRFADYSGNKVAGIPDIFYNAGLTISPDILEGLYVDINMHGIGKYFVDDANKTEVPAYNIFNITIGTKQFRLNDHFNLKGAFSINNLSDVKYASSAFVNPDILARVPVYLEPGLPRNFTLSFSLELN